MSQCTTTLVELHVPDFITVKKFYHALEFTILKEVPPSGKEGYLVMSLEQNVLCFWCGNEEVYTQSYFCTFPRETPLGYGVEIALQVGDIEEYYKRISPEITLHAPLQSRPWGVKDFRLVDPFGYYLRVTEPVSFT